jgi:hypothetical protein
MWVKYRTFNDKTRGTPSNYCALQGKECDNFCLHAVYTVTNHCT